MEHRGYFTNGPGREHDILGCSHCRRQLRVTPPKGAERVTLPRCSRCDSTICPDCAKRMAETLKCIPFEEHLERIERKGELLRRVLGALALVALVLAPTPAPADSLIRPVSVTTARPSCTEARRGTEWTVFGGGGVADSTSVCQKNASNVYSWVALDSTPGSGSSWGTITGTLSSQTDLQSALDAKSATSHNHAGTYEPAGTVTTHEGAADPHTGYQRESEKAAASGYASLDTNTRVPTAQLGTGSATSSTYLRGDGSWATVTASGVPNMVAATVDFGSGGADTAAVALTGQAWVTASSSITCTPTMFATTDRTDGEEDALVEGLACSVSARSVGTGFTVSCLPDSDTPNDVAVGKFLIHCSGL